VNCYPFIEAEKAGDHNVERACELLGVSRSAYYTGGDPAAHGADTAEGTDGDDSPDSDDAAVQRHHPSTSRSTVRPVDQGARVAGVPASTRGMTRTTRPITTVEHR
jgi:hypothetical protein